MTKEELIAKARVYAQESAGLIKVVGTPKYRAAAVVYFQCERKRARVEIIIDTATGEFMGASVIPRESELY